MSQPDTDFGLPPITLFHAALVAALHARCFDSPWTERSVADLLGMPGAFGFVIGDPDPVGFVLCAETGEEAEILSLAVLPEARRRGLAWRLMGAVLSTLAMRGVNRLYLEVAEDNQIAQRLYDSLGMRICGRRPHYYPRPGGAKDAILMEGRVQDLLISKR